MYRPVDGAQFTALGRKAHYIEVQIDARSNTPTILKDEEVDWRPRFEPMKPDGKPGKAVEFRHGTCVTIEMEAAYVRGPLSVDEYIKQCAVVRINEAWRANSST